MMTLNMGPQHPSTHGVLRLLLELDGETILKCQPDIGYLHTGIEKEFEVKNVPAGGHADRSRRLPGAALEQSGVTAWRSRNCSALEIPPQAQWMRVMLTEFTRLNSHLVWLGTHAIDIGAMSVFLYCFREREEILRIFEMFSGQRMMTSYFRIGGLALEPPRGWQKRVRKFIDVFPSNVDEYEDLLTNNPHLDRAAPRASAIISLEDMLDLGVTGPMLRAAGLKIDVRKDEPYSSYEKFDFEVPTRTENDVFARYQVRMEEMRQSARIVRQALEGMPAGPWQADAPHDRAARPRKDEDADGSAHLSLQDRDRRLPRAGGRGLSGDRIAARRGGLLHGERRHAEALPRAHAQAQLRQPAGDCPKMIEGTLIADVIASIGQHGFRAGRYGPMKSYDVFSPRLKHVFAEQASTGKSYPAGRTAFGADSDADYAQDEVGSITDELIEEVARRSA